MAEMDTNTGGGLFITAVVDPLIAPSLPVIVAEPCPEPVA